MRKDKEQKRDDGALQRWEPDRSVFSLRDAMNRLFDESVWDPFDMMPAVKNGFPKVDISETDKEVKIVADVPGINPKDINIEVEDDYLSISGKSEKESGEENKEEKIYRYEREYGEFKREFTLPAKVDKDAVSAKTKNGVLTITLPKTKEDPKKKIQIESE